MQFFDFSKNRWFQVFKESVSKYCQFWVFKKKSKSKNLLVLGISKPSQSFSSSTTKASYTMGFQWMVHWWLLVQSGSPNWSVKLWIAYGYIHIQSICFPLPVGHSEPGPTGAP
jgi:hypothetical protein